MLNVQNPPEKEGGSVIDGLDKNVPDSKSAVLVSVLLMAVCVPATGAASMVPVPPPAFPSPPVIFCVVVRSKKN